MPRHHMTGLAASFFALTLTGSLLLGAEESYRNLDKRECPILDTPYRTLSGVELGLGFPASTDAAGWGDLTTYEVDAWVRIGDWENESGGDLEIQAVWNSMILQTSKGSDGYPLTRAGFMFQWSQRYVDGFGTQISATPGVYSALQSLGGGDFSMPISLVGSKAFSPDTAVYAGIRVYPMFQQVVDAVLGFVWSDRDEIVVQVGYPESRFEYSLDRDVRLLAGARFWTWPDYCMGDDVRERMRFSEGRAYCGVEWAYSDFTLLSVKAGYLFGRKVSFESNSDDVTISNAPYITFGISGSM